MLRMSSRGSRFEEINTRSQSLHWRWIAFSVAGAIVIASAATYAYLRDMRTISERMAGESRVIATRRGPVEFASWGSGPAVLVAHGAGGGYDQGTSIAKAFGGEGFRWIAPSRFGYLRTPLPADASTAAQADAFAALLDGLGIDRVAIVAMSGGVPPALQFALRYPARTSALVLLSSAPYTPLSAGEQRLPVPAWVYQALFSSDFPYWALQHVARARLETIFDVKPAFRAALAPDEQVLVTEIVDAFEPVTKRTDGLRNEVAAVDPKASYPLRSIAVPTLVIHSRDDGLNPFAFGEYTARHIAGAEFMPLTTGGHLLLGHRAEVQARVNAFLRKHAVETR